MRTSLLRGGAAALLLAMAVAPTGRMPAAQATVSLPSAAVAPVRAASGPLVTLDDLSPTIARPGTDVTLRATVSGRGRPVPGPLTVRVLTGPRLSARDVLADWLHDASTRIRPGTTLAETTVSTVTAGTDSHVSLTLPAARLARSSAYGSYPLLIEVRDASGVVTSTRSVLPWVGATPEYEPLRLAWVAPLTLPADPGLTAGPVDAVGAAWGRAIGRDGTLQSRLDAAAGTPVTWMVDPQILTPPTTVGGLVTSATAVTTSTAVAPSTGATTSTGAPTPKPAPRSATATSTTPSTKSSSAAPSSTSTPSPAAKTPLTDAAADAQQLGTRLARLPDDQQLWALPPGDPDAAALIPGQPGADLRSLLWPTGTTALDKAVGTSVLDTVAWPADGAWPSGRRDAWTETDGGVTPSAALVSTSAFVPTRGRTPGAAQSSDDGLPLLAYDEQLSEVTAGDQSSSDAQLVQEFLGDSLTLLGERPGRRRTALVAVPRWTAMSGPALKRLWTATGSAPWLRQVQTASVLGEDREDRKVVNPDDIASTPLAGAGVQRLELDVATLAGLGKVMPAGQRVTSSWSGGLRDLASARWRDHADPWAALRTTMTDTFDATRHGVQVRPSTINFLADAGTIQITVTNTLPYPVHDVRLQLVPGSPKLRVDQAPRVLAIGAGSRTTTQVHVTALGEGTVPLEARLTTSDGVTLGVPTTVDMNVRPTSVWVFALIAGIVGAILVLGLARSLRRRPTRAERELGDKHAVAEAVLGPDSTPKDTQKDASQELLPDLDADRDTGASKDDR